MNRPVRVLAIAITIVAVAILGAPSAAAQQTITVFNPDPEGRFYASANVVLIGLLECVSTESTPASEMTGRLPTGTYQEPANIGVVETLTLNNCGGPIGSAVVAPDGLPYTIRIDSFDSGDRSAGYITGIVLHVSMPGCEFDVVGDAPYVYDNAIGELSMGAADAGPSLLTPINVVGCFGFVNPGDEVPFVADYGISPHITISSP